LGWASDFHHGVGEKWFVVFVARRFFGQPRRNLWMGLPTTKGDIFLVLFGRTTFVGLLYSRTRRGKEAIVLCCFTAQGPKGKGGNLALKGRSTGQCYVAFYLFLFIYLRPARVKGLPG
jgi:hypothetical protein